MFQNFAVLFDMDGVLVDNNPFHKAAWAKYCELYNLILDPDEFFKKAWGKTNEEILGFLYDFKLTPEQVKEHTEIKEGLYRDIFKKDIKPLNGLLPFLKELKQQGFKTGVATSGPRSNLNFVLDELQIRNFMDATADDSEIRHGKPSPEVYLKLTEKLGVKPNHCITFEDSLFGIQAAIDAKIRVIGITTTHSSSELNMTEFNIPDFSHISIGKIRSMFDLN